MSLAEIGAGPTLQDFVEQVFNPVVRAMTNRLAAIEAKGEQKIVVEVKMPDRIVISHGGYISPTVREDV